jgi:PEP-CTERM motif
MSFGRRISWDAADQLMGLRNAAKVFRRPYLARIATSLQYAADRIGSGSFRSLFLNSPRLAPMMTILRRRAAASIFLACLFSATAARADYTFSTFSGPGGTDAYGGAINDSGQSTGFYFDSSSAAHGFIRDPAGGFSFFDASGAASTYIWGINNAGVVAGETYDSGNHSHGFVRDVGGTVTPIDVTGAANTHVNGIDNLGEVAGAYQNASGGSHGFVRTAGGAVTPFDVLGADSTYAGGIDGGQVSGSYFASGHYHGYVRDAVGGFTLFDAPASTDTFVFGINGGQIVGYFRGTDGFDHGFLRDVAGTFNLIDVPESDFTEVTGINSLGQLTGDYIDSSDGSNHGFVASPSAVPEPASIALLGIGVTAALSRRLWWSAVSRKPS